MHEQEAAFRRARRRAADSGNGIGVALLGSLAEAFPDADVNWRGVVAVVDNHEQAAVVVRSSTRAMTEAANPELVAEIVEEIVAGRGDVSLLSIGQRTAGIVLEDHAPELVDAVFFRGR